MQWSPCNTCVSTDRGLGFISRLAGCLGSRRGVLPSNQKECKVQTRYVKVEPFVNRRYTKGFLFHKKWCVKG